MLSIFLVIFILDPSTVNLLKVEYKATNSSLIYKGIFTAKMRVERNAFFNFIKLTAEHINGDLIDKVYTTRVPSELPIFRL